MSERGACLEKENAEADLPPLQGRPPSLGEIATAPNDSAGVVAPTCIEDRIALLYTADSEQQDTKMRFEHEVPMTSRTNARRLVRRAGDASVRWIAKRA